MTILSEQKIWFFNELEKLDLYRIKPMLNQNQYAFDDVTDYFPYANIDRIVELVKLNITDDTEKQPKISDQEKIESLQSLIKEGFLYLIRYNPEFLERCQKVSDGKKISNYLFMDSKTPDEDIIFLHENFLFSSEHLIEHLKDTHILLTSSKIFKNNIGTQHAEQLLKVDSLLEKNSELYKHNGQKVFKEKILEQIAEHYFFNEFNWEHIIKSDINKFLKLEDTDYHDFLLNHYYFFQNQFTHLKTDELKKILKHAPNFIGNEEEWLLESLAKDYYKESNSNYYEFSQDIISLESLQFLTDNTPASSDKKLLILSDLIQSLGNIKNFYHFEKVKEDPEYINKLKQTISNIEKIIILDGFSPLEPVKEIKKRI